MKNVIIWKLLKECIISFIFSFIEKKFPEKKKRIEEIRKVVEFLLKVAEVILYCYKKFQLFIS